MAFSGPGLWACYAVALLVLFVANANSTVTYTSTAYSTPSLFTANLDDNSLIGVCQVAETPWVGAGGYQDFDCGDSGYSATASWGYPDADGYIDCNVAMSRPGFSGSFDTNECQYNCDCGSDGDCVTWTAQSW
ncbi:unnamed protein product [Calypogeia fissa]